MNENFPWRNILRGAWRDRDTNDIFAHCSLIFYFLDFKFSNFVRLFELHPLIWFFFKKFLQKKENVRKTTQNAFAPSIFIVLSIVLKLGTPLLHTQAQNTLLQNTENEEEGWPPSQKQCSIRASRRAFNYAQGKMNTETNFVVTVSFTTKVDHQTTSKISEYLISL